MTNPTLPQVGPGFGRLQQPNYWAVEKLDQFLRPDYKLFFTQIGEIDTLGWCWDGQGGYDYSQYEHHIGRILAKKPDSHVILFLGGRAPYAWQRDHSGDLVLLESGKLTNIPSIHSPRWIADTTEAVRRLVAYFEGSPYAGRIAGYNPILHGNEWLVRSIHTDHSVPATTRFREWLSQAYAGDEQALRRAWKQPDVTFDTAAIPRASDYAAQGRTGQFDRHEHFGTHAADYLRFFNQGVASLVCAHSHAIKEASQRRKLVSVMFGYTYSYAQQDFGLANSGHAEMLRVLESPDVDLIHCPYDYYNRCAGGPHYSQISADTVQAHGKIFATQIDSKLGFHNCFARANADNPWESVQILKRDVSFALMRNACHYYYEMCVPCWRGQNGTIEWKGLEFNEEMVQDTICRLKEVAEANHREQPACVTEVAIFHSRASAYDRAYDPRYGYLYLQGMRNFFLAYTGVPFHDLFLEDFDKVSRDYKVYLFPDATTVTAAQREAIRSRLEKSGATAVWFYAPGYVSDSGTGLKNMEALTGIRFRKHAEINDYAQMDIVPVVDGLSSGSFGSDIPFRFFQDKQEWLPWILGEDRANYKFSPQFTVDDPGAETLGLLRSVNEPGFVRKKVGGMTSYFSAAPCPTPGVFRFIFRGAGVHIYSDREDIVYANARYVTLCANGDGARTLQLPCRAEIRNGFTGEFLAKDSDQYHFTARHGQVEIFRIDAVQPPGGGRF